jgi:WD40 repeat protein
MASLRRHHALRLFAILTLAWAAPALPQEPPAAPPAAGLYDRPVLVLDPGMHTARIWRADVDAEGRYAVTGSDDKTVRVWSVEDGRLLRTIRVPAGPGDVGKVRAVAVSPDGKLIAAGGWTRWTEADPQQQIYLFDRETGDMAGRIEGLPGVVLHLTFSPDGRHLAATLGWEGLRVYARDAGWAEVARDTDYGDGSWGADFSGDGRLATTSRDGGIRLYDQSFQLVVTTAATGGQLPYGIAFSPDGAKLAIGYADSTDVVDLFDARTLAPLPGPDTAGMDKSSSGVVAWSADGETLFAAGGNDRNNINLVVAWRGTGLGARRELPAGTDTIMSLAPLPDGSLLVAAQDPYLAVLNPDGRERWVRRSPNADFRNQHDVVAVSADGRMVNFDYELWGQTPAQFNVATLALFLNPPDDGSTTSPKQDGLSIEGWRRTFQPTLDGRPLLLERYERSRSLAVHPDGKRFVLGTEWFLRAYDANGENVWRNDTPGVVWAVNITGDGRLVVAAYGDGTIHWHRMDDGRELLAFFPLADRTNWVAWTPEGLYAATPGARGVLRWHVNHGWDRAAEAIPVHQIAEQHRPDVLPLVLQEMDEVRALGLAERKKIRDAVRRRTGGDPAGKLHLLSVGVSEYEEEHAKHLRLRFADADARDVASALIDSQNSLYADVAVQTLQNNDATRRGIRRGLEAIKRATEQAPGRDLVVVQFSGHGAVVDGKLYLLPHDADPRTTVDLKDTALSFDDLRDDLVGIAQYARVLVLLDACRSGTATMDGTRVVLDAAAARAALAAPNVTVLTSTAPGDPSVEDERWANGAFTEAFLDALRSHADRDHDGLLSVGDIEWHVSRMLPQLTGGRQQLGIEKRFDGSIFVAGL